MRDYREFLTRYKGQREQVRVRQGELKKKLLQLQSERLEIEQASVIIQETAQLTQKELRYQISELVTLALTSIFEDPPEFEVGFEQRRNQMECDMHFVVNGNSVHPLTASAGGEADVAAFALQIALWSLKTNRTRPLLVLDEPLKFLKGKNYPERGARLIKDISDKLGIQIIYVTHIPEQVESADNVIIIKKKRGISYGSVSDR